MALPFDARVLLLEDLETSSKRWVQVKLFDNRTAWMQRGDLKPFEVLNLAQVIELSHRFLERPYVWGGTSSKGFDCSGYMQTLFRQMGVILPRDSRPQSSCLKLEQVEDEKAPGDLIFFGESRITHVGLYLGKDLFINAGVRNPSPKTMIADLNTTKYNFLAARRIKEVAYRAKISPITAQVRNKMTHSWRDDNPVALDDLRYIQLNHWGFDGCVHEGELIVHKKVADEVVDIFEELFSKKYPIEKMLLVDAYKADDELSCADNNSSCFCSRLAVAKNEWSFHSFGLAIDINPLLNPYHRNDLVVPANSKAFLKRDINCYGILDENDACYKAFVSRGWLWGGDWKKERGYVDYQHFYKEVL